MLGLQIKLALIGLGIAVIGENIIDVAIRIVWIVTGVGPLTALVPYHIANAPQSWLCLLARISLARLPLLLTIISLVCLRLLANICQMPQILLLLLLVVILTRLFLPSEVVYTSQALLPLLLAIVFLTRLRLPVKISWTSQVSLSLLLHRIKALPAGCPIRLIPRSLAERIERIPLPRCIDILLPIVILHMVSLPFPYPRMATSSLRPILNFPGGNPFTHLYTHPIYKWFHLLSIITRE